MQIHQLYRRQELNMALAEAWDFFSSPHHLNDITPAFFHVEITSGVPPKIYAGLMIGYRMKAVFGIPMAWLSEISHCDEPKRFVYQQRLGPFKFWSHEVCLTETGQGVQLEDIVFYAMPFGWLGDLFNRWLIADRLERIFDARRDCLKRQWPMAEGLSGFENGIENSGRD
jgi:ligand-binding SRPBCC domain-containing protein